MGEDEGARGGPLWDTILGGSSDTGTIKMVLLALCFAVIGGTFFWVIA